MFSKDSPLEGLIEQFRKLQGIGAKSANRFVFQLLAWEKEEILSFARALERAANEIGSCPQCFNISCIENNQPQLCDICQDPKRKADTICLVSNVRDLIALERTGLYKGMYHVLHGLISPLDGVGPEKLKIRELLERLNQNHEIKEVILALSPSTEGEATTLYLNRLLSPLVPKVYRLAFGLSVGGEIDQTDELTLARALEGKRLC